MKSWPAERFSKRKRIAADFFVEDIKIRNFIEKKLPKTGISKIVIRKTVKEGQVIVFATKVGAIMGKQGAKINELELSLEREFGRDFKINIKEVKNPELSAKVMAEFISNQLEARMPYRRVIKNTLSKIMEKGAIGVKIQIGGRLNGADIARTEKFIEGKVSLQTFRSDIDYHYLQAMTKYGVLGVKVRIEKGVLYNNRKKQKKIVNF